jgi:serine/threonine-protein kinase RsbW
MSTPASRLLLTLTNDLVEIPRLAEEVERFCEPLEPSMKDLLAIQLALEETVTNVINHGYGGQPAGTRRFTVELSVEPTSGAAQPADSAAVAAGGVSVRMVVRDDAPAYDPLARPPVDISLPIEDRPIGGLGVHLVKNLMQHTHYERADGHNVLTMDRVLNAPAT